MRNIKIKEETIEKSGRNIKSRRKHRDQQGGQWEDSERQKSSRSSLGSTGEKHKRTERSGRNLEDNLGDNERQ